MFLLTNYFMIPLIGPVVGTKLSYKSVVTEFKGNCITSTGLYPNKVFFAELKTY